MNKDEALDLALRSLKELVPDESDYAPAIQGQRKRQEKAITAIKQARSAPRQEPVAWQVHPFDYGIGHEGVYARTDRPEQVEMWKRKGWNVQPLYTTPPAQPAPVQEPVAIVDEDGVIVVCNYKYKPGDKLYTTPPAAQKKPDAFDCGVYLGKGKDHAIKHHVSYQPAPVQVSPLEFVTMVMEKEHLVGKPLFWAEWPNKENT